MTKEEEPKLYTEGNRQEEVKHIQDAAYWRSIRLPEIYGDHIDKMMNEVGNLEKVANQLEAEHTLTLQTVRELLDQLRIYPEKILRLDEKVEESDGYAIHAEKRKALVEKMAVLRERLMNEEKKLGDVGDVYRAVKIRYDSVQHMLTIDQRREVRAQIATLSSLVQRAKDERLAQVGSAVLAAVSHATEHAPAVAHAATVSFKKSN